MQTSEEPDDAQCELNELLTEMLSAGLGRERTWFERAGGECKGPLVLHAAGQLGHKLLSGRALSLECVA